MFVSVKMYILYNRKLYILFLLSIISDYMKTVKVEDNTHERLTEIGQKGQTYDEIINKLIVEYYKIKKV